MSSSFTTADLVNDTMNLLHPPEADKNKSKPLTAEDHLKAQQKMDDSNNPLILQLQKEARERTFLGVDAPTQKKPRGRPKKATPESTPATTPLRSSTGGASSSSSSAKKPTPEKSRLRRIKQIYAYMQLYPHLVQVIGTTNLHSFDIAVLNEMYEVCRTECSSSGETEYAMISKVFFTLMDYFEPICGYLVSSVLREKAPNALIILSRNPPGSFSQYLRLCSEAGDGIETELRELSIDWIDFLPNNVYIRLATKIFYKIYDYQVYKNNDYLSSLKEQISKAPIDPSHQEKIDALRSKRRNK